MRFNALNRKIHYWASIVIALPLLVIIGSGLMLQLKKQWSFVQPPERRGTGKAPTIGFEQILATISQKPELEVASWNDVARIDVRPGKGMAKVQLVNGMEAQVDLASGALLQAAYRRSDLIESIHDGSFFAGDGTKLGLFLPTGIVLFCLWLSGMWLFWAPIVMKRRRAAIGERTARTDPAR